jgi:hypothetical protein
LGAIEVMFQSKAGDYGNLEGVSIWRDGTGHLRASMIADNNYLVILPTEIVEYRLPN